MLVGVCFLLFIVNYHLYARQFLTVHWRLLIAISTVSFLHTLLARCRDRNPLYVAVDRKSVKQMRVEVTCSSVIRKLLLLKPHTAITNITLAVC